MPLEIRCAIEAREAVKKCTKLQIFLMKTLGKKVYISHEKHEGWRGELPFYLFWCALCERFAKDYPHGFIETQYLSCPHCNQRHGFVPFCIEIKKILIELRIILGS